MTVAYAMFEDSSDNQKAPFSRDACAYHEHEPRADDQGSETSGHIGMEGVKAVGGW